MDEKHNHSNNPASTQPIDENGKYMEKESGGVTKNDDLLFSVGAEDDDDDLLDFIDDDGVNEQNDFDIFIEMPEYSKAGYNEFAVAYELDKKKIAELSESESKDLFDAIKRNIELKKLNDDIEKLKNLWIPQLWKNKYNVTAYDFLDDYDFFKESIPKKKEYLEQLLTTLNQGPASKAESYIKQLDSVWEQATEIKDKLEGFGLGMTPSLAIATLKDEIDGFEKRISKYQSDDKYAPIIKGWDDDEAAKRFKGMLDSDIVADENEQWSLNEWVGSSYHAITEPLMGIKYHGHYSNKKNFKKNVENITNICSRGVLKENQMLKRYTGDLFDVDGINAPTTAANGTYFDSSLKAYLKKGGDIQSLVGKTWRNRTFMATTPLEKGGYNSHYESGYILLDIKAPKGTHGVYLRNTNTSEREMLLQRGNTLRIDKAEKTDDKNCLVRLTVSIIAESTPEELEYDLKNAEEFA